MPDQVKPRMDLLPWRAIRAVAALITENVPKHGDRGGTLAPTKTAQDAFNSAARHLAAFGAGEGDEEHATALAFNALVLVEILEAKKEKP